MEKYDNLNMYIFSCGNLNKWQCPLLTKEQQTIVAKEFVKLYKQIESKDTNFAARLLTAPAAKTHHQNYVGGLTEHNFKLACYLYGKLLERFNYKKELDLAQVATNIAVCHDLCKVDLYSWDTESQSYKYDRAQYAHHALKSIQIAQELGFKFDSLTRLCVLLHMGLWANKEDFDGLTPKDFFVLGEDPFALKRFSKWDDDEDFDSMLSQIGWKTEAGQMVLMTCWADMQACK